MTTFILYNDIAKNIYQHINMGRPLTENGLKLLAGHIERLTIDQYEILYVIILHYFSNDTQNKSLLASSAPDTVLPYKGKTLTGGKGIQINLVDLPPILQSLIAGYIVKCFNLDPGSFNV
ncbi:Hypothetical protein ORPV_1020 [Orpheovirus IHUMI-LCC2]|uniref:Uncharacterized protein n=1 Tax=Orpheovirus IHUMI-LCC2 TaxID=2023057 RepID=A0A2I2L5W0_9VIRU|nr:Hypothetical protein ORPV_1020 [Orpheovirus IHUMI-LCC2]SNW62924.1 Hypothetical protein ORPV_1020 [Orpheovirus IHUMI-LCC2]